LDGELDRALWADLRRNWSKILVVIDIDFCVRCLSVLPEGIGAGSTRERRDGWILIMRVIKCLKGVW
jgi:hypothetical protein